MMKIGFIGLGIMGKPMAANLIKAGYTPYVYNRSLGPVTELTALGAVACQNAQEVAGQSGSGCFLMLPDTPDVETVLFGVNGVSTEIKPDRSWWTSFHLAHRDETVRREVENPGGGNARCPCIRRANRGRKGHPFHHGGGKGRGL